MNGEDEEDRKHRLSLQLTMARLTGLDLKEYGFDAFKSRPELRKAVAECKKYANGETSYHMLTLAGPVGVGKTHLGIAICGGWIDRGLRCRFTSVVEMLDDLKAHDIFSITESFYAKMPLLVLDDLGVEYSTPWAQSIIDGLINLRYQKRLHTVITTNFKGADMPERIADRLRDIRHGKVIQIAAKSYRQITEV